MQKQALAEELADATAEFQTAIEAVQTEERAGKEELMVAEHRVDTEKMVLQRLSKAHTADIAVLKERIKAISTRITDLHSEISAVKAAKRPLFQWVERALTEIPQEALQQLQSLAKEIS
jgi:predicted  nucleic acid-binding Zn-ribbon protein